MAPRSTADVAAAFRTTVDLFEAGVAMKQRSLRRRHPDASEEEIERRLRHWLHERPGAEYGDSPGRRVDPADLSA